MKRLKENPCSISHGFTLIELLLVMAMLAILLSFAAPSFFALRLNQKLSAVSNELYASTLQARNEALALNRRVTVAPVTGTDWSTGWRIYVDLNNNGSYDTATDRLVSSAAPVDVNLSISGGNGTLAEKFSFDSRGFLLNSAAGRVVFTSPQTSRVKHVIVYATGRSRVCDPKNVPTSCDAG